MKGVLRGKKVFLLAILFLPALAWGFSEKLLFVGEDVKVLTVASKHPESPEEAPAICEVITREEIQQGPFRTVADLLRTKAGIFVTRREMDFRPYFRGVPEGFLLLYDGVPLTSDSTKALYDFGEEMDLLNIERVEIVRGPASVLWGPDAFAGLINLVPRRKGHPHGRVFGGSPEKDFSASLFLPFQRKLFSGVLNLYYYGRKAFPEGYSFPEQHGEVGRGEFYEAYFSLERAQALRLSGRLSQGRRPAVMRDWENYSWPGERRLPTGFLKLETHFRRGESVLRTTFYYEFLYRRIQELFLEEEFKNHIFYGELLFDRSFLGKTLLLTLGSSWRHNLVRDATVSVRGYLPAFLRESRRQFRPLVETANFETDLYSLFAQIRRKLGHFDLWAGLRFSDHNHYKPGLTHQLGALFRWRRDLTLKLVYGTSYRTPYAIQFLGRHGEEKPEKMRALSAEIQFKRGGWKFFLSPFYQRISHHIAEDPFGGYSKPFKQYFLGFEVGLRRQTVTRGLSFSFTGFNHWGDKETYQVLDYVIIIPGKTPRPHYSFYEKEFSSGPKIFGEVEFYQRLSSWLLLTGRLSFASRRQFWLLKEGEKRRLSPSTLLDISLRYQRRSFEASLIFKNLLDKRFLNPGKFSPLREEPFGAYGRLTWYW